MRAALFFIFSLLLVSYLWHTEALAITIPDPDLEAAIRYWIDKPTGPLTKADLADIGGFHLEGWNISDLTGLEHCTNLEWTDLSNNQISDVSPLANLANLTDLNIGYNYITDIKPLANLTNLVRLSLDGNYITDIGPLANLTELVELGLDHNYITDISPLANLTKLVWLKLPRRQISDISPLANLTNLKGLDLPYSQISDISALANMANLTWLDLSHNQISDISSLTNLTYLTELDLSGNSISNISPLANATHLGTLYLQGNRVTDISALTSLTYLAELDLSHNQISNINALASLTYLTELDLSFNQISDISSLVNLIYLDDLGLDDNPLNDEAYEKHIPALKARGVDVDVDSRDEDVPIVTVKTKQMVAKGDSFSAIVILEDIADLGGFQLDVVFDPSILEAVQVDEGTFLSDNGETYWLDPKVDNASGSITGIICTRTEEGGVDGDGILAVITFRAVGAGETHIRTQNIRLSDPDGNLILYTTADCSIIVREFPPWDVNKDGRIDISDLVIVGRHFGEDITTPLDPNPDVNGDGKVDIRDFVLVGQNFGKIYSSMAPTTSIWSFDAKYLPVLIRMYSIMEDNPSLDSGFSITKRILRRLIFSTRPGKTEIFQNYPNPFNPQTWIPFQLSEGSEVEIGIYNSKGQLVRILDLGFRHAGCYMSSGDSARWDGKDECGEEAASGVYFYTIRARGYTATRKMLLVR